VGVESTGPARPRSRQRPRRSRQEIIDAAARIFYAKGYESASIQDIADELGILKGSIYYHVRSKEDMLFEILVDAHDAYSRAVADIPALDAEPLSLLREFVTRHVMHCASTPVATGVFFRDFNSLASERREIVVAKRDEYEHVLRSILAGGVATGTICPDLDPDLTGREIVGMLNWTTQWYRADGPLPAEEIAASMADLVVLGVACDPRTHSPGHRRLVAPRAAGAPHEPGPAGDHDGSADTPGWLSSVRRLGRRADS
jgi:AcrR family transcriptional regulator